MRWCNCGYKLEFIKKYFCQAVGTPLKRTTVLLLVSVKTSFDHSLAHICKRIEMLCLQMKVMKKMFSIINSKADFHSPL